MFQTRPSAQELHAKHANLEGGVRRWRPSPPVSAPSHPTPGTLLAARGVGRSPLAKVASAERHAKSGVRAADARATLRMVLQQCDDSLDQRFAVVARQHGSNGTGYPSSSPPPVPTPARGGLQLTRTMRMGVRMDPLDAPADALDYGIVADVEPYPNALDGLLG